MCYSNTNFIADGHARSIRYQENDMIRSFCIAASYYYFYFIGKRQ